MPVPHTTADVIVTFVVVLSHLRSFTELPTVTIQTLVVQQQSVYMHSLIKTTSTTRTKDTTRIGNIKITPIHTNAHYRIGGRPIRQYTEFQQECATRMNELLHSAQKRRVIWCESSVLVEPRSLNHVFITLSYIIYNQRHTSQVIITFNNFFCFSWFIKNTSALLSSTLLFLSISYLEQ